VKQTLERLVRAGFRLSALGLNKGPHITRYAMYEHLSEFREPRPSDAKVLSISGSQNLGVMLGFEEAQIVDASYPEHSMFELPFDDASFDAVVSDQVLEHLEGDPQDAVDEAFRVMKPGGLALHTTCFMNPMHACPNDFWRFTPQALELLASKHGEVIEAAGWGNPYVWLYSAIGLRFMPIPHARWHPGHWIATKNDPEWPIATWVLTRKR